MQAPRGNVSRSNIMMMGHHQTREKGLGWRRRALGGPPLKIGELPLDSIRPQRAENVELALPGGFCLPIGEVDDYAPFDSVDGCMRLIDEAFQTF